MDLLNANLRMVRDAAKQIQEKIQADRKGDELLNAYATGDMVLFDESSRGRREEKLRPRFSGPCIITSVHKSDWTCSHLFLPRV